MAILPHPVPTGLAHGTVTSMVEGVPVEVTTYRADDTYADARHPDSVRFVRSLEEDLARRDFTVNALAWRPPAGPEDPGRVVDLFGGLADLATGVIRAVGNPALRFHEDGLRPFRAVRFAALLDFDLDPDTEAAIPGALDRARLVAVERMRDEFLKMLAAAHPSRAIETMRRTGLLELVLPELLEAVGVWQNRWHAYDVYVHSLHVLDAAPADKPIVRLAALLHDVGKPRTKVVIDGQGTFYNHQHVGAEMTRALLARLRFPKDTVERVAHLVDQHMFHYEGHWTDAAVRRFIRRVGPDAVADLFDLRIADALGKGPDSGFPHDIDELRTRVEVELERRAVLDVSGLDIDGRTVMEALGIGPGPGVGKALQELLERVLEDPSLNRRDTLLALLRDRTAREKS
jgi:tRNA nucleotidyltransferase (CCA-adding enzyme)